MQVAKGHAKIKMVVLGYFDLPPTKISDFFNIIKVFKIIINN